MGFVKFNEVVWNRCDKKYEGSIRVANLGVNPVTSVKVDFSLNGSSVTSRTYVTNIASYTVGEIKFRNIPSTKPGEQTLKATVARVNNKADTHAENNEAVFEGYRPSDSSSPFSIEDFEGNPVWRIPKTQEKIVKVVSKANGEGNMLSFQMNDSPADSRNKYLFIEKHFDFSSLADNEVALISFIYNYRVPAYRTGTLFSVSISPSAEYL